MLQIRAPIERAHERPPPHLSAAGEGCLVNQTPRVGHAAAGSRVWAGQRARIALSTAASPTGTKTRGV